VALSWVQNAYLLAFGGLLLLGARAGDLVGRRRIFIVGLGLFTLASVAVGAAQTEAWLIAARAFQGVGAAILAPSTLALLQTSCEEGPERTRAVAYYAAVAGVASTVGLVVGGIFAGLVSWRVGFFINLPIGAAMILAAPRYLPETQPRSGQADAIGAATSTLGMTALVFGIVRSADAGWSDGLTLATVAAGVLLLALFVANERRAPQPILPLRLFSSRERSGAYAARLLFLGAMAPFWFFTTQWLQNVAGYSPVQAGLAFMPTTVVNFAAAMAIPKLTRRYGNPTVLVGGLTTSLIGMAWLSRLGADTPYLTGIALPMMLIGAGQGGALGPLTAGGIAGVTPEDAGAAGGITNVAHQIGGSLGLAVLVAVFRGGADRRDSHAGAGAADRAPGPAPPPRRSLPPRTVRRRRPPVRQARRNRAPRAMSEAEILLVGLLVAVAGLSALARLLSVPYPIMLVLGGAVAGFVPGLPRVRLDPEVVLVVFLPPLLYGSGVFANVNDFRADLRWLALNAVPLVLVTMSAVAVVAHALIPGLPWEAAFVLGAIVSPTDPLAAATIMRRLGVPRRMVSAVEGEGLFNDATALVAYRVAVIAVTAGTFSLAHAGLSFVLGAAGGVATGLLVAWAVAEIRRRTADQQANVTISLLTGHAAFVPADAVGASGILATVAAGIYMGIRSPADPPRAHPPPKLLRLEHRRLSRQHHPLRPDRLATTRRRRRTRRLLSRHARRLRPSGHRSRGGDSDHLVLHRPLPRLGGRSS
jgi:EmrB/QacA subfamily drug resistance transporter